MTKEFIEAIKSLKWKSRYMTEGGETFIGIPVSQIASSLRDEGWKRVPRLDPCDLRKMGFEIKRGKYANGASKTRGKACEVVVLN